MLKIRKLQQKDIKTILGIMKEFPESYPSYYVNSLKRGGVKWLLNYAFRVKDIFDAQSFVLETGGKAIGHINYYKDVRSFEGMVYELKALIIDKKYQGKGYGAKLMKFAERKLRKIKARIIWLQTNKKEAAFYKALGYKPVEVYRNYWGKNRHRYVLLKYLD